MTFRVDDLMVAVLPEPRGKDARSRRAPDLCDKSGEVPPPVEDTTGETNCAGVSQSCTPDVDARCAECEDTQHDQTPPKKQQAWRDEQFALLSRELESALESAFDASRS